MREKYDHGMSELRERYDTLMAQLSAAKNKKATMEKEVSKERSLETISKVYVCRQVKNSTVMLNYLSLSNYYVIPCFK